jgi:outer membrane lipoprotein LolB
MPGFRQEEVPATLALSTAPTAFRLEGRVSVKAGEESFSGGLVWRRGEGSEEILLRTPLGQGVAELRGDAQGVTLTDVKGVSHRAMDADTLVRQALGLDLPLRGLTWWVVGHPRPDAPYHAEPDEAGRLSVMEQDDWRIDFSRYASRNGRMLPGKLVARRGEGLEVRLVVDSWELP